jgi:hypothetical protein
MGTLLFFNNGNESAAGFRLRDLTVIEGGNDIVNLYFQVGSLSHKVVLACAADASDLLARELTVLLSGNTMQNAMVEIANDDTSTYINSRITGVTSLTIDANPSA